MKILITNDDGIMAGGLKPLRRELAQIGEVIVVVPDRPRSACSHSVTLHKPLRLDTIQIEPEWTANICNGTPADCVALAFEALLQEKPDLLVSGINLGPNLGDDVTYSGTVAGAMEGAIFGVKSVAISVTTHDEWDCAFAAQFTRRLVERMMTQDLPPNTFLNVNIPALPPEQIKGVAITRQGTRRWLMQMSRREDPRGVTYWWRGGEPNSDPLEEDSDVAAVLRGEISVTPLQLDLTHHEFLRQLKRWKF